MNRSRRALWSWALYDWANSAFATTVMAGFFPLFFKQYWAKDLSVAESSFQLGLGNSVASLLLVALAPLLGAVADRGGLKRRLLLLFTLLGVAMTGALYFVAAGHWALAIWLYVAAQLGFSGAMVPYDALLLDVVPRERWDHGSALGYALGYLGGGLLFALNVLMVLHPDAFGFPDATEAVRFAFLSVALWWAVFSVPVLLFVGERGAGERPPLATSLRLGLRQLGDTARHIRQVRPALLFLFAYWLYIDGVDTVVRMAVDYGLALGFEANGLMTALLITQFVGFPAALAFGRIGERYGPKQGILLAIVVYLLTIAWASRMETAAEFYVLAVVIGLVQGGVQSLSRSLYARLIPPEQAGEFYGFYNMLGKFAAVIGPFLVGWVGIVSGSPRIGILSVGVLFLAGAVLLWRVEVPAAPASERVQPTPP
ncbi:MAG: MFS transporter [Gammaproteobacteria bacterium]|jgi:UMF1 family MFS transporter|nr:MFS transporter [Gammaproteobacteria bacterium]